MDRAERIVNLLGILVVYAVALAYTLSAVYISIANDTRPAFVEPPCAVIHSPALK